MKIITAPDSFKESMSAAEACAAFHRGWQEERPEDDIIHRPLADGGEGTTVAICNARDGEIHHYPVEDALGNTCNGFIGFWNGKKNAVIEIAAASGLERIPADQRDPLRASTYGTGQLIRKALDEGARELVIGLGGSATNDGGAGLLTALGAEILDAGGQPVAPGGAALESARTVSLSGLDSRLKDVRIQVASDVRSPLLGPQGASAVFGPQKGADRQQVAQLEQALGNFADILEAACGRSFRDEEGAGAAGGAGFALLSLGHTEFHSGIGLILELTRFADALQGASLVITGEGRMDAQSLMGKTPQGVLQLCQQHGVPVMALAGSLGEDSSALLDAGFTSIMTITPRLQPLSEALSQGKENMAFTARNLARFWTLASQGK